MAAPLQRPATASGSSKTLSPVAADGRLNSFSALTITPTQELHDVISEYDSPG